MGKWMEATDPKSLLKRKVLQAFKTVDADNSGCLDIDEFREIMQVINVNIGGTDLVKIFNYIDTERDGRLELEELQHFLDNPFEPHEVIRVTMDLNLVHPKRFLKYHTWHVKSRPFEILLQPGSNSFGAYFLSSSNPELKWLQEGSQLMYINSAPVDEERYVDISNVLETITVPFELTFQSRDTRGKIKSPDQSGRYTISNPTQWDDKLSPEELSMISRTYMLKEKEEKVDLIIEAPLLPPHCSHCPPHTVWYLNVHLFMDDEKFSTASHYLAWLIMSLIALSTFAYVLQTLPRMEHWALWGKMEEIVAIVFSIEYSIRLASCRNIVRYLKDPWNIVDLCAIAPFWIEILTVGLLDAKVLRTVRALRLLRLVRLAKRNAIGEIMEIYIETFRNSLDMVLTLFAVACLTLIVFASFANLFEMGHSELLGNCAELNPNQTCNDGYLVQTYDGITSKEECEVACESWVFGGCCLFEQITGNCSMLNITEVSSTSSSSDNAGLCGTYEQTRRKGEEVRSPFLTVTESFWWATVSMTIVGYGEFSPITVEGKLLAVLAVLIGLFFFALPVTVIGWNFLKALNSASYRKQATRYEAWRMSMEKKGVKQLLQQVNEVMKMELFETEDELVFLDRNNQLNTKRKVEEVLRYDNGWGFLPFADNHMPDFPRITQFNMFVLFSIFGRNYQKKLNALEVQKRKFNAHLQSYRHFPEQKRHPVTTFVGKSLQRLAGHSTVALRDVNSSRSESVASVELKMGSAAPNLSPKSDLEVSDHSADPDIITQNPSQIDLLTVALDDPLDLPYANV